MKLRSVLPLVTFGLAANGCLLPEEFNSTVSFHKRSAGMRQSGPRDFQDFPVGQGDRFNDGQYAPRGLGTDDRDLESLLNVGEVETGLKGLANAFGSDIKLFTAPYPTFENRQVHGATIGTPRVFIQSGLHARERGGPDGVLYFMSDLLAARANGTGVAYGDQIYTNRDVMTALSAGITFLPLVNPDGVAYDQQSNACWRKNRNTKSATGDAGIGIDLNRNFAIMWDYKRIFNRRAKLGAIGSDSPSSDMFRGTGPLSEAETQNVAWVMGRYTKLSWFLDVHSFGGHVLYGWGDDDPQTKFPTQSFTNRAYDGMRGLVGTDPINMEYREFIERADLDAQKRLSQRISTAMNRAGSVHFAPKPSSQLYLTAGGSTDYALGQYYGGKCGANRINGLTMEFGWPTNSSNCPFYPDADKYHESVRQVAAGLMELLLTAAGKDGDKKVYRCQ
ncbi:Carboxypeptidase A1 [Tolypocladium capitatum]|uniref:Carboxypeptidase A1 n=1 Tax=Tolypocladium capitatum TaxID=45235 RepID=A0A2K3QAL2_9HYPO|nr:Carboxypeptidase A1 [Tolypocladium capitatum]